MSYASARVRSSNARSALCRAFRYRGLLVLVLWQVPVRPTVRSNGSIGFMVGGGVDEYSVLSCEGDVVEATRKPYRVAAVEADLNISRVVRLEGVAGRMSSDFDSHAGSFGGGLLRADYKRLGFGGGVIFMPYQDSESGWNITRAPAAYLRVGNAAGAHLRADIAPPTALGPQQLFRIGVGLNAVDRDRFALQLGVTTVGMEGGWPGPYADLDIPLTKLLTLRFEGHAAKGASYDLSGAAVGLSFRFPLTTGTTDPEVQPDVRPQRDRWPGIPAPHSARVGA